MKPDQMRKSGMLVALLVLLGGHCYPRQMKFRSYGTEEGLQQAFIYTINQDGKGFLWIGTADGLYRFDGYTFAREFYRDSPGGNFIRTSYRDPEGRLWFGQMNGRFGLYDGKDYLAFDTDTANPSAITGIVQTETGDIWITRQSGDLFILDTQFELKKAGSSHDNVLIFSMLYLGNGIFLLGTPDGVYVEEYSASRNALEFLYSVGGLEGVMVSRILRSEKDGDLVAVSSQEGIFTLVAGDDGSLRAGPLEVSGSIRSLNIKDASFDSQGSLWLGTLGSGALRINPSPGTSGYTHYESLNTDNGLPSNDVRCIFEDAEGNMWFGLYGTGLARQIRSRLSFFVYGDGPGHNSFYSIAGEGDHIWAASDGRLIRVSADDGSVQKIYTTSEGIPDDRILALHCQSPGRLWMGTESSGLYKLETATGIVKKEFLSRDDLANAVNYITGRKDEIWVATKNGLCVLVPGTGKKKWYTTYDGLSHNNIRHLFVDSRDNVLIGNSSKSLQFIDGRGDLGEHSVTSADFPIPITCIAEDARGGIWMGSYGSGVFMTGQDLTRHYTAESGLLSDYCYALASSDSNHILVAHQGGLTEIDIETGRIRILAGNSGISGSSEFYFNAEAGDRNGRIWLGSSEGLIRYDGSVPEADSLPPSLSITGLWIDNEPYDPGSRIDLKPGFYKIEVGFTGISFNDPDLVEYRYILEGFDQGWSDLTRERKATYGRVGPGEYTFHVKAENGSHKFSEVPGGLHIRIRIPFFLKLWFYLSLMAFLVVSVYFIIVIRERNLRRIQKKLIRNLDDKTKEVILKEEIIRERKKVEKELIEARNRAEQADNLKSAFLTNISHEVRTPMNAIVGFSQLLGSPGLSEEKKKYFLEMIQTNSNSLLALLDDIFELSRLETGQLRLDIRLSQVNPLLEKHFSENLSILENAGKSREIEFRFIPGVQDDNFSINTDPARLGQILDKLLDNAIKYTENGHIHFGYDLNEEDIRFFVTDTGIGLKEEQKEYIFKLFGKDEGKVEEKLFGGTGLGLSIAQRLVILLGGRIGVESETGKGSTFYFSLPVDNTGTP